MQQQKLIAAQKPTANDNNMSGNSAAQLGADRTNNALATIKAEKLKATIRKRTRSRRKNKKAEIVRILTARTKRAGYKSRKASNFIEKMTKEIIAGNLTLDDRATKPRRGQYICCCKSIGCYIGPMMWVVI